MVNENREVPEEMRPLEEVRQELGASVEAFSARLGVHFVTYYRWLAGTSPCSRPKAFLALARTFKREAPTETPQSDAGG